MFGLTIRIEHPTHSFLKDMIFGDTSERSAFMAWCQRNPDKATWISMHPVTEYNLESAQRYVAFMTEEKAA